MDLTALGQRVRKLPPGDVMGRVSKVVGLIVESRGPEGSVGEQMLIHLGDGRRITAEVVGFNGEQVLLMPVENIEGIRPGLLVEATGHQPEIPVAEATLADIYFMAWGREPQHVALITDKGIIHSYSGVGKVVEHALDESWRRRIVAAYRYPVFSESE